MENMDTTTENKTVAEVSENSVAVNEDELSPQAMMLAMKQELEKLMASCDPSLNLKSNLKRVQALTEKLCATVKQPDANNPDGEACMESEQAKETNQACVDSDQAGMDSDIQKEESKSDSQKKESKSDNQTDHSKSDKQELELDECNVQADDTKVITDQTDESCSKEEDKDRSNVEVMPDNDKLPPANTDSVTGEISSKASDKENVSSPIIYMEADEFFVKRKSQRRGKRSGANAMRTALQPAESLTIDNYDRVLAVKKEYIKTFLRTQCKKLQFDMPYVVKDRTKGYYFKLEKLRYAPLDSLSERFESYSNFNRMTGKAELGYKSDHTYLKSWTTRNPVINKVYEVIKDFMESSKQPYFNPLTTKGFWKSVMIGSNFAGKCIVVVTVHVSDISKAENIIKTMKPQIHELFENGPGKDTGVKSFHLKVTSNVSASPEWGLLYGVEFLEEEALGLRLYMHKNLVLNSMHGTPLLCNTISELLELDKETAVITRGTTDFVTMFLAKTCKVVYHMQSPMDSFSTAGLDENIKLNGMQNIVHFENSLDSVMQNSEDKPQQFSKVCAVLSEVTLIMSGVYRETRIAKAKQLRHFSCIKKLIYSCVRLRELYHTLKPLCSSCDDNSDPFVIVKVVPIDITPTNNEADIIVLLVRASELEGSTEKLTQELYLGPPIPPVTDSATTTSNTSSKSRRAVPPLLSGPRREVHWDSKFQNANFPSHPADHRGLMPPPRPASLLPPPPASLFPPPPASLFPPLPASLFPPPPASLFPPPPASFPPLPASLFPPPPASLFPPPVTPTDLDHRALLLEQQVQDSVNQMLQVQMMQTMEDSVAMVLREKIGQIVQSQVAEALSSKVVETLNYTVAETLGNKVVETISSRVAEKNSSSRTLDKVLPPVKNERKGKRNEKQAREERQRIYDKPQRVHSSARSSTSRSQNQNSRYAKIPSLFDKVITKNIVERQHQPSVDSCNADRQLALANRYEPRGYETERNTDDDMYSSRDSRYLSGTNLDPNSTQYSSNFVSRTDKDLGFMIDKDHGFRADKDRGFRADKDRGFRADKDHGFSADKDHGFRADKDHGFWADKDHGFRTDKDHGFRTDKDHGFRTDEDYDFSRPLTQNERQTIEDFNMDTSPGLRNRDTWPEFQPDQSYSIGMMGSDESAISRPQAQSRKRSHSEWDEQDDSFSQKPLLNLDINSRIPSNSFRSDSDFDSYNQFPFKERESIVTFGPSSGMETGLGLKPNVNFQAGSQVRRDGPNTNFSHVVSPISRSSTLIDTVRPARWDEEDIKTGVGLDKRNFAPSINMRSADEFDSKFARYTANLSPRPNTTHSPVDWSRRESSPDFGPNTDLNLYSGNFGAQRSYDLNYNFDNKKKRVRWEDQQPSYSYPRLNTTLDLDRQSLWNEKRVNVMDPILEFSDEERY